MDLAPIAARAQLLARAGDFESSGMLVACMDTINQQAAELAKLRLQPSPLRDDPQAAVIDPQAGIKLAVAEP